MSGDGSSSGGTTPPTPSTAAPRRPVSVYGRARRLSVGPQDPSGWTGEEDLESLETLMAVVNKTSTGQQVREKPEDNQPSEISSERAKETKKFLNEKFAMMRTQVEEGGYNPLKNRRRRLSTSDSLEVPSLEIQTNPDLGNGANTIEESVGVDVPPDGETSPKTSKPLPTKKTMQKLREKLKAKANSRLGKEDRDDSDNEMPSTPVVESESEKSKFGMKIQKKSKADEPSFSLNTPIVTTPAIVTPNISNAPTPTLTTPPSSYGAIRTRVASSKKTPLGKTSSTEGLPQSPPPPKDPKDIPKDPSPKGRFRSHSSAANLDRPSPPDYIKPKLRVDTTPPIIVEPLALPDKKENKEKETWLFPPNPDPSNSPIARDFPSFDLTEHPLKRAEALLARYADVQEATYSCGASTKSLEEAKCLGGQHIGQIEARLEMVFNAYAPMNEESSQLHATLGQTKETQAFLNKEMAQLHEALESDARTLDLGFQELNEISQGLRQAMILSNKNSQITEIFWMLVAWVLAGLAGILWVGLSIEKFLRGSGSAASSTSASATSPSSAQGNNKTTLDTISTNPEVWRKRLRSYFEKKHQETTSSS